MNLGDIIGNVIDAVTGKDRHQDGQGDVQPASRDPFGDPADQQVLDASQDPFGDPADMDIRPASEDPYGDPADEEEAAPSGGRWPF